MSSGIGTTPGELCNHLEAAVGEDAAMHPNRTVRRIWKLHRQDRFAWPRERTRWPIAGSPECLLACHEGDRVAGLGGATHEFAAVAAQAADGSEQPEHGRLSVCGGTLCRRSSGTSYEQAQCDGMGSPADKQGDATRRSAGDRTDASAGGRPATRARQVARTPTAEQRRPDSGQRVTSSPGRDRRHACSRLHGDFPRERQGLLTRRIGVRSGDLK